jgi:hypothetical protein
LSSGVGVGGVERPCAPQGHRGAGPTPVRALQPNHRVRNTDSPGALLAALCLLAAAAPACVMPQHRAFATVVNTVLVGAGVAGEIAVAKDNANPDSWHLFNKQAAEVSGAMIVFALFGELITLGAHDDREAPREPTSPTVTPPPALDCATVLAVLSRASDPEQARLWREPAIAACGTHARHGG